MSPISLFILGFVGSLLPILAWLWFLEHEDKHPEPLRLTLEVFLAGMASVAIAIPLEKIVYDSFHGTVSMIVLWATIEELVKFGAAAFVALRRAENDEPIDSMMYMIAAALGFALIENSLFIFRPLLAGNFFDAVLTSNYRFLGATILHVVASSTIGAALALAYYKNSSYKRVYLFCGLIIAVSLHAAFNLSIIYLDDSKAAVPFYAVWVVFVGLLLAFEKVKQINKPTNNL